jgi:hypothetical protein
MNGVLGLSADFIDRLSNPTHGAATNESYGARLRELIDLDPSLRRTLSQFELNADDAPQLSTSGWAWYLTWRRSAGMSAPAPPLMDALFDMTPDPVLRLKLVEIAATDPLHTEATIPPAGGLETLPPSWLRSRLMSVARGDRENERPGEQAGAAAGEAEALALMLLQVGSPLATEYLRAFLSERGPVRDHVRDVIGNTLEISTAGDSQRLREWRERLNLDGRANRG